jgi:hypothetical protein
MLKGDGRRVFFGLFKAGVFLGLGATIGFCLALAYSGQLYGPAPVVTHLRSWVSGEPLLQSPAPGDQSGAGGSLISTPAALIPGVGAFLGFAASASILLSLLVWRIFSAGLDRKKSGKTGVRPE